MQHNQQPRRVSVVLESVWFGSSLLQYNSHRLYSQIFITLSPQSNDQYIIVYIRIKDSLSVKLIELTDKIILYTLLDSSLSVIRNTDHLSGYIYSLVNSNIMHKN